MKFPFKKVKLNSDKKVGRLDYPLMTAVIILTLFGVVMVYSASSYAAEVHYNDAFFFARKQAFGAAVGILAMLLISYFNYNRLKKFAVWFAALGAVLLGIVLIPGIGHEVLGARRWINLPGFTIQPSEIAKFCFVIFTAWFLSRNTEKNKSIFKALPVFGLALLYGFLIMLQPNMSTTMCLVIVMAVMLFFSGINLKQFVLLGIPAIAGAIVLIISEPYRLRRLFAFIDPWQNPLDEGFQLIQSLYSLGSGGFFGVGLFNSRQKLLFLPFSESDFIFSIIGEELGFFGCACVIGLFLFVLVRGVKIALKTKNRFACYLVLGIISVIIVQTIINIAVVSGSIPPTGLPLPFISSGSTSLIVFLSAVGIVLNVSRENNTK